MRKVLHIIPGYGGGISSIVRNLALHSTGDIKNDVAGFSAYPVFFLDEMKNKGNSTFVLPPVHRGSIWKSICAYKKILDEGHYDLVHIHVRENQFLYFAVLSKLFGVKRIVAHAHIADSERMSSRFYRTMLHFWRWCTCLLATDLASCSRMATEFVFGKGILEKRNVMHIPNGVEIEKYRVDVSDYKRELMNEIGSDGNELIIGNVGYLGYQKNHPFMIAIAENLKKRGIRFKMLFVGHGWAEKELKMLVEEKGLTNEICFLGRRDNIHYLYKCFDLALLPSFFEGLPTVAVESQAAGVQMLLSDTITKEVDLDLGLLNYYSLDNDVDAWVKRLLELRKTVAVERRDIEKRFRERNFTSDSAADLYGMFVRGDLLDYTLGTAIEKKQVGEMKNE